MALHICIKLKRAYFLYNFKSEYYSITILYENLKVISNHLITFLVNVIITYLQVL